MFNFGNRDGGNRVAESKFFLPKRQHKVSAFKKVNFSPFFCFTLLIQELIGEIDQEGNGCITFNEFVCLMNR